MSTISKDRLRGRTEMLRPRIYRNLQLKSHKSRSWSQHIVARSFISPHGSQPVIKYQNTSLAIWQDRSHTNLHRVQKS